MRRMTVNPEPNLRQQYRGHQFSITNELHQRRHICCYFSVKQLMLLKLCKTGSSHGDDVLYTAMSVKYILRIPLKLALIIMSNRTL